jgi:tetratricopeptide (TPR) repeat protein
MRYKLQSVVPLGVVAVLMAGLSVFAQTAIDTYQQALVQLRGAGNIEEAIKLFELTAKQAVEDRPLAARALLGAAEAYERLGQARAYATYQELVRKYPDQKGEASSARAGIDRLIKLVRCDFENAKLGTLAPGWYRAGSGRPLIDPEVVQEDCIEGQRCILLPAVDNPPQNWFNTIGVQLDATPYFNQKVRFRAAVRTESAEARPQIWLRVDRDKYPKDQDYSYFHNSGDINTISWAYHSIVGTVSPDSKIILFGVVTHGKARVWVDDVTFEIVDSNEPVSRNMAKHPG